MKIGLDAGHYLKTAGKQTLKGVKEWTLNKDVCDYIQAELSKYKNVEIKRLDDPTGKTDIDINTRRTNALNSNCDLIISIHHNAYNGKANTISGTEVYYHTNSHHKKAIELAKLVAPKLAKYTVGKNRGVKNARFAVISTSKIPAILCEGGFMDSTKDEPIIASTKGKQGYAKAIVEAVAEYYKLEKKKEGVKMTKQEAINKLKTFLEDKTIQYLDMYRYGDDLIIKLAQNMK